MSRFDVGGGITQALEERDADGRVRVLRALLERPVIGADQDPELFRLARRHGEALRSWFERETGWRLTSDSQAVRLQVSYVPTGSTAVAIAERHPARARKQDPGFTRRRYVLLCIALAVLERSDPQVALGRLADEIVLQAHAPGLDEVGFTLTGREERSDLVAVIRLLVRYGVLARVAGDEESFAAGSGDALYDLDRRVMSTVLSSPHSPGVVAARLGETPSIDDIESALHEQPRAYTDDERNRRLRQSVARRLLSDPVVYYDELPDEERDYLLSGQRVSLTRRLCEATGLVAELRAEGIALVDPDDRLTDIRMPEQGTEGHATLLIAEHLAGGGSTDESVTVTDLRRLVRKMAREYTSYWRKTTREPGAENALVETALERMVGLGLVRVDGEGQDARVIPLPALGRFAVAAPTIMNRRAR